MTYIIDKNAPRKADRFPPLAPQTAEEAEFSLFMPAMFWTICCAILAAGLVFGVGRLMGVW